MRRLIPIILLIISFLFVGCASKRYLKKGIAFEQVGYYEKASEMYLISLQRNKNNVDAAIGMRKTGQLTLNKMLDEFMDLYNADKTEEAVEKYLSAQAYYKNVQGVGVDLTFPSTYADYYDEVKNIHLEKLYQEAYLLFEEQDFERAEKKFDQILAIDPNYGNVAELRKMAHYEPIYRKGTDNLLQRKYRSAYFNFNEVVIGYPNYKDSKELMDKALNEALITIKIIDFKNLTRYQNIDKELKGKVEQYISQTKVPFYKIVDTENKALITKEQLQSLEKNDLKGTGFETGNKITAKAIFIGEIMYYNVSEGKLIKTEQKGYIKEVKKEKVNDQDVEKTIYHKTNYYEYYKENEVSCKFQFKLISTETSQVLVSDIITLSQTDIMNYAEFVGNKQKLIQGYWESEKADSPKDVVKDNSQSNNELNRLLNAGRSIKSVTTLTDELHIAIAQKVTLKIENYDPEK